MCITPCFEETLLFVQECRRNFSSKPNSFTTISETRVRIRLADVARFVSVPSLCNRFHIESDKIFGKRDGQGSAQERL